jgi:biopolymer transport protein ExbB
MSLGGPVLRAIAVTIFVMWVLIVERMIYFRSSMKKMSRDIHDKWESRPERQSWNAKQIRELMISRFSEETNKGINVIQTLVALCPLLGLLGTVTGMIEVFDVMAIAGSGNAKAMAGGVSRATIPTMAGMVAALSGLILSARLEQFAHNRGEHLADRLEIEQGGD